MDRDLFKMALILGLMSTIGPFAIDMYLPALPRIAGDLGVEAAAAQLTLTAYFVAFGVAQLFYGPASDMFGRKPPITFGIILFALASLGCALAPTLETLSVLRFIQGLGAAGVMSVPRAIIRDRYTGAKATRLMSSIMLVISISPMLAPLVGSLIIGPFGWRAVFVAVALAAAIAMLLHALALPETLAPERRKPFSLPSMLASFGKLARDPAFMGLTFIGGLGMSAFFTFLGSASFVYVDHFGLTANEFALAFAANAAGFFLASQFAANLMARLGPVRLMRTATFFYALFSGILFLSFAFGFGSFPLMVVLLILANTFFGFVMPASMVLALEEHGPIAGAAASLGGTLQMLLASLAMAIGGLAFDGTPLPMLAVIATCSAGTFILALVTVRGRRATTAAARSEEAPAE
ncbi:MAG: multidrug effflux MFS transporter [Alphaproteobacteria bacterium]|nr:multidrug effflux MFS transporter [Alphaproteobacteria bacterium]